MGRAAVIDIGSNTIHLLVADCGTDEVRPVRDLSLVSGLGTAVAAGRRLGDVRIRATAVAVTSLADEAGACGARTILAVGTHAVRAASDRARLVLAVERAAGVNLRILSPQEEALLSLAGATLGAFPEPPYLFADIGGGSCDLAAVHENGTVDVASVPAGSGTLGERTLAEDPPSRAAVQRAADHVDRMLLSAAPRDWSPFREFMAAGGAARRLGRQGTLGVRGEMRAAEDLMATIDRVLVQPCATWQKPSDARRAPIIRGGAVILRVLLCRWAVPAVRISPYGLREGLLRTWARRHCVRFNQVFGPTVGDERVLGT